MCIPLSVRKPPLELTNDPARSLEQELIPCCNRYGIDVVVYNPLAGGLFSGKIKTVDIPAEGRYSNQAATTGELYRKRYFKDSTFDALRLIEPVAKKHNLRLLEVALRWCTHHSALNMQNGGRDGVIIGVSNFSQLESNLKDLEKGPLPEEVIKILDEAWLITKPTTPNIGTWTWLIRTTREKHYSRPRNENVLVCVPRFRSYTLAWTS